ncbi:DUF4190 domain-containing protein [Leucobacter sp. 7(1)]|uniref:DUF4190 domain-containing protein n=1 Tax=Leucobacter sp. 7(1) TaxID=1255613 RepID=UPI0020CF6789|nr:DUF4190 domain-containing protein [Leucobacter sp. 7(1)]
MTQQPPPGTTPPQDPQSTEGPRYAPPVYAAPEYPTPGYPGTPAWQDPQTPVYPVAAPVQTRSVVATNTLAILALISAFVAPFVAPVVLGHISLNQIKRTGEGGRGLAIAALILGYIQVAFWALLIAFFIWVGVVAAAAPVM